MLKIHERYRRTDRRTDGGTTYDSNTALCALRASRGKNVKHCSRSVDSNSVDDHHRNETDAAYRWLFRARKITDHAQQSSSTTILVETQYGAVALCGRWYQVAVWACAPVDNGLINLPIHAAGAVSYTTMEKLRPRLQGHWQNQRRELGREKERYADRCSGWVCPVSLPAGALSSSSLSLDAMLLRSRVSADGDLAPTGQLVIAVVGGR